MFPTHSTMVLTMKSSKATFVVLCSLLPLITNVPVVGTATVTGVGFVGPLLGFKGKDRHTNSYLRWGLGTQLSAVMGASKEKQLYDAYSRPQHQDFDTAKRALLTDLRTYLPAIKDIPDDKTNGDLSLFGESQLAHLVEQYFGACNDAHLAGNTEATPQFAASMVVRLLDLGLRYGSGNNKYRFDVHHKAMRGLDSSDKEGHCDFYAFACDFVRPLIDLDRSIVLGTKNVKRAFRQVNDGDNVMFFANHQSELDTPILSVLLEAIGLGIEATCITYVAGHKVTTDPIAIPFSMGQNLICVHSKKHIMSDPTAVTAKKRQNYEALSEILGMLNEGGAVLWVAPSGGRDRRNTCTNEVLPARFDLDVVEKYRLMGSKSKTQTHYYPLSMLTYELCPPPDFLDSSIGEKRNLRFKPVGIAIGEEVGKVTGVKSRRLFAERVEKAVFCGYCMLRDALQAKLPRP